MNVKKISWLLILATTFISLRWAMGWNDPFLLQTPLLQNEGEAEEESPQVVSDEEKINVEHPTLKMDKKIAWTAPNYIGQESTLGWTPDVFKTPLGMEERVQFWIRIYTQLTTHQGILHDSEHMSVIYDKIDFSTIENDKKLSERQMRKAKKALVEDKKKEIRTRLALLTNVKDPTTLSGEDLRIWNLFSVIPDTDKFKTAAHKKRLRFQLGQSDRFLQGIYYSGRYLREMEKIFRERGLPIELTRLPFVESSFNVAARSRVGASGVWQFVRYTGRRFMRINYAADERNDPLRATEAAARLFRMNFDMLKQWPLAITGYNHGPAGVLRVTKKFDTTDIVQLVDERYGRFGFASANFFASFIAAVEVEKNAKHYFGANVFWDEPIVGKEVKLTRNLNHKLLEKWFQNSSERAQAMNFHLSRAFWQGQANLKSGDFVRVPASQFEVATNELKILPTATIERSSDNYYVIGQGETLSDIALQLGVNINLITELNEIDNPRRIRAGQKIRLPAKQN